MKTSKHTAIAKCKSCGEILISSSGGHFVSCKCNKSFLDQERFGGAYQRLGGEAELIEVICPDTCEYRDTHTGKQFKDTEELDKYMSDTYKVEWKNGEFTNKN